MPNPNVLVVEDDEAVRRLLIDYFRLNRAIDVDGARDGVEAWHRIVTRHYDVMILDMMMPKMSGADLLDSLAALASDPSIHAIDRPPAVLVITSYASAALPDDLIVQHCPSVIHGIFRKPLDIEKLAASVGKYLDM
ncbi:MAG: two-component system, NtrC family, response regulator HydG [Thermoanaerobaculia bacterium]|jgi:CheY-like chemotaxis protein|nr:two-component system, NtrC family, response regulator HydG [Thermoanaerobaculia bacterium]